MHAYIHTYIKKGTGMHSVDEEYVHVSDGNLDITKIRPSRRP
jgi:hypothetical protein